MKRYVLSLILLSNVGALFSGGTIDFLGDRWREGTKFAQETFEEGKAAVFRDVNQGIESARKGIESTSRAVQKGAEYVVETGQAAGKKIGEVSASILEVAKEGAQKVEEISRPVVEKVGEGFKKISDTAQKGTEAVGRFFGTGAEATKKLQSAVQNTVNSGVQVVKSGVEFIGTTTGRGIQVIGKTAGKGVQVVGEGIRRLGVVVEDGAQRSPEEISLLLSRTKRLVDDALEEGLWRAKEVVKMNTGAAGVYIKNNLSENLSVVSSEKEKTLLIKGRGDLRFVGAQMRISFLEAESTFLVKDSNGNVLAKLHTGFNGDLLWVSAEPANASDAIRSYIGGHNGQVIYNLGNGIKVRAWWWINPSKYFLHDIQFDLLEA